MKYGLFKVKQGKLDQWQDWCLRLQHELYEEALQTVIEEGNTLEAFFTFQVGANWYALGCGFGEGRPADRENHVNQEHARHKEECLEFVSQGESSYQFFIK